MATPYFNSGNVGAQWGPPPGLAAFREQQSRALAEAADSLGNVAGMIGGGAVGAFQGAASPEVFGAGTSKTSGAFQGFAQNVAAGQGGGGGMGGFSSMINGGGGGGGTPNFKQLKQSGKDAESAFRTFANKGLGPDGKEQLKLGGMTFEEFENFGSREKVGFVQSVKSGMELERLKQGIELGKAQMAQFVAHTAALNQETAAEKAQGPFWNTMASGMTPRTTNETVMAGPGLIPQPITVPVTRTPSQLEAFQAAAAQHGEAMGGRDFHNNFQTFSKMASPGGGGAGAPEMTTLGKVDTIFNRKTGQFQLSPFSKEEAKPEDGYIELPDQDNPVFGPKIRLPLAVAEKKYPHLLKGLAPPATNAPGKGKPITDKKGKKWLYLGTASDPSTDKDPSHWQAQ